MYRIPENAHVVNIVPPVDCNGGATVSDYFSMGKYGHVDIILTLGVTGAAATVTLEESSNLAGGSTAAIVFDVYKEETDAGDTLGVKTRVTVAGFATSTNDNLIYVISVDAAQLSDGFPCLVLKLTDPAAATLISAVAVLSRPRYAGEVTPTAIA